MEGKQRAGNAVRGNRGLFWILASVSAAGALQGAEGPVFFNAAGTTYELRPDTDIGTRTPLTLLLVSTKGESTHIFVDFREASAVKILFGPGAQIQFPHLEPTANDQCFWFDIHPENGPLHSEVGYLCFQSHLSSFRTPTVRLRGAFYESLLPPPCAFRSYGNGLLCLEPPAPKFSFSSTCVIQ